ncbi:Os02g0629600 [Oryza sativa Japonica Group]|uniref:Os02g0629600 protein n=2 Tax=Oryza sativa subsp. japonica TaxID=39947 RepID=Q6K211_ORYSJ|nr:unknown protein [Oryza sativa Japonica Group]BAS79890.1 Os02g0629600 [Oryza sativa Japonica Group]
MGPSPPPVSPLADPRAPPPTPLPVAGSPLSSTPSRCRVAGSPPSLVDGASPHAVRWGTEDGARHRPLLRSTAGRHRRPTPGRAWSTLASSRREREWRRTAGAATREPSYPERPRRVREVGGAAGRRAAAVAGVMSSPRR